MLTAVEKWFASLVAGVYRTCVDGWRASSIIGLQRFMRTHVKGLFGLLPFNNCLASRCQYFCRVGLIAGERSCNLFTRRIRPVVGRAEPTELSLCPLHAYPNTTSAVLTTWSSFGKNGLHPELGAQHFSNPRNSNPIRKNSS